MKERNTKARVCSWGWVCVCVCVCLIIEVSYYCAGRPNPTLSKITTNKIILNNSLGYLGPGRLGERLNLSNMSQIYFFNNIDISSL